MERIVGFILSKFPFLKKRLDMHMLEVINGALVAFVLKVLGAGFTFMFNLLLARTLGAEGAGIFFLALTVTTIATVFGRMGLDNTLLRFTAANAAVEDWSAVKGAYEKGVKLAFIASFLSSVVLLAFAPLIADTIFDKPELVSSIQYMAFAVVPNTMLILHAETLKGLKRIKDSLFVFGLGVPATSFVGFYLYTGIYGVDGAVWAYVFASVLTALLGFILWRIATPQLRYISGSFQIKKLLKSSMPLFWVTSLNMMINWMATFVLGIWGTKEDVGVFSIASRTAMLTSFILLSVNSISAPKYAELYKKNELQALALTAKNTTKIMTLIAVPIILLFLIVPQYIMGIFGSEFEKGGILLSILAVGQFVNVATGSVGYLLMMSGNEKLLRNNAMLIAVVSVVMSITLIPVFGVIGAVVTVAVCLTMQNFIATYFVWKKLKILTLPFM